MSNINTNKLLSIQEASKYLKVSTKTLRRWESQGRIQSMRTSGGHRRYDIAYIEKLKKSSSKTKLHKEAIVVAKPKNYFADSVQVPLNQPLIVEAINTEPKFEDYPNDFEENNKGFRFKKTILAGVVLSLFVFFYATGFIQPENALVKGFQTIKSLVNKGGTHKIAETSKQSQASVLAQSITEGDVSFNVNVVSNFAEDVTLDKNIAINGGVISSTSDTFDIATNSSTLSIGGTTGITTVNNSLAVTGNLDVNGSTNDIAGTLNLSGNTLSSTTDLLIDPGGGGVSIGTGTAGNIDLAGDDFLISGDLEVNGSSYIPTLVINSDTITDITGTGLQVSSGVLATTLGTSITTSEIENDTILEIDLDATNDATNGYALTYDSSSGGFTWTDLTATDENGIETVQESDVTINSVTSTTIDFLGGDFDLSESPAGELNVQLSSTLTTPTGVAGSFDVAGQLVAGTADAFLVTTAGEIQIPSTQTLQIGTIELNDVGVSNVTSGAVLIGVFDELANSSGTNLQDVLDDLDSAIGAGSSKWTQDTGFTYLTSTTDDLVVGGSTVAGASLYFDESAGNLYLGTNETTNGTLTLYSSGAAITDPTITTDSTGNLIIDSVNFDVTTTGINSAAIGATTRASGAFTTLAANSTVTLSALTTAGPVITNGSGVLSSESTLALARGGTNKNITASNGQVVYSDSDSFELTTSGVTDECLKYQSGSAPIWEECVTSAQVPFTSDGSVITKTTIGEYLSLRYGDAGDTQLEVQNTTTGTIPTTDAVVVNLSGGTTGIVTDGADGVYIVAEFGDEGTNQVNSGLHLDIDPVAIATSDDTFYALNIDGLTGTSASEVAINIGSGWDREINLADTTPVISIGNTGTLSITDGTNTLFSIADDTSEGDVTATGDLAVNGATSADITSTTATATVFNSGVTTLSLGGAATTLNLADAAVTGTIDIGGVTADGATTVNIATNSTSADAVIIGNSNASTTLALTGGDDWSISNGGVITLSASGAQTTAIIVTDTDYTNALSIGDNDITGTTFDLIGTTATIDFTDFDVDSDGKTIIGPDTAGDALTLTLATDVRGLVVDASSADSTTTTGVLDFNIDAGNAAVLGLNIDFAQSDGATADTDAIAQSINLSANDADGDVFGLIITGNSTANAAAGSYEALLKLVNAEPTIGVVTDGILIDSTSGTDTDITDAIDVSDANIVNAINIGANAIAGTNFAVSAAGTISIASGQTLTIGTTSLNETTATADSGASLVGTFDEFTNSNGANVQDVLDDLDAAIGAGSSKWSINTTPTPDVLYPTLSDTTAGNDFALGGTAIDAAPFGVDVSANTIYVGDAATAGSTSVIFKSNAGGATGTLAYNTSDQFSFTGGDVVLGDTLTLTSDANQGINGGGLTDCDDAVNSKLLWDATTNKFSCGSDGGAGTGSSKWTDGGAITYLTATGDDLAVGASNTLVAPFSVDVSANTVRIGDATVAGNAVLSLYASDGTTGNLTYNTSDQFQFSGGNVLLDQDLLLTSTTPSITLTDSDGASDDYSVNVNANVLTIVNDTDSRTELSFAGDGGIDFGDNTATKTIDIGGVTASAADSINIATNGTAADTITVGNSNASTTVAITGGDDWSITAVGALDINGQFDLGDGGDTGTINTSDWDINATGDASGIGAITADGAIAFTPGSTSDIVFTGDADSNFQIASTVASDVTLNVADITINATGTGATNTLNGLAITNAAAAGTTSPDSLIYLAQSDTDETVTNGIFIENTAGGTLSTGLRITETAGTITDAILISGTLSNILNTDSIDISGGGAITGATGIVSSGTITFSGLSSGVVINSSGTLSSEAQLALTRGGTNKNITATAGTVVYSDADSFELTATGTTGQCLTSNGSSAPTWAGCDTAATTPFTTSGGIIDKTTAGDRLRLVYGDAADVQLTIENTTNGTIPTTDGMQIDLTGGTTGLVTDGADGLLIATEFGNGTANTNSGLHIDINPVDVPSGDETFYALNIDGLSAGTSATETAINIGSNWDNFLNTPSIDITGSGAITGAASINGLVITANDGTITTGTWNGTTIAVANGGTGATTLTSNGVLYGNGTSAIGATTAGTNGQLLLGVTSSAPAFATMSGDATITNAGVLSIAADAVALSTDTTGTYVGDVTSGSGISVSGTPAEGYTETIALGSLTANWSQTGAFDIVLNNASSELILLESSGGAFFGTIDVGDLTADRTYTFPDATGTVCLSTGNCTGLGGEITGSGAAGQAAFFTDADSITSENNFEWDSTNDVLSLGTGAVAADTSALLDLYGESEYAVLRPADVSSDGDTNNSGILRLRGTYDSDVAVGPVTSSNFNFDIRNIMTAAGASPASRLDFLNNSGGQMLSISSAGVVTVPGSADGTDALVLTAGDILVTDGDVDLSGGDFNVVLDAGDGVNISKGAAPTVDVVTIAGGSAATNGVDALSLTLTATNQTDFTNSLINGTLTAAGTVSTDIARGLFLDLASQAGGTEKAIEIENTAAWDTDIELQNDETISNTADGTIALGATTLSLVGGTTLVSDQATVALLNTTTTTVNAFSEATSVNLAAGGALTRTVNIGTGTGADTISIGTGATTADDINIGGLATSTIDILGVTDIGDGGTTNYATFNATGDLTFTGSADTIIGPATFNLLNSASTTINFAGAASTLNIGPTGSGAGSTVLAGGSADTGCTLDHATGNLACSGTVTTTNTSGTVGFWTRDNATTTLTPATAGDDIQLPDSDTFIFGTGDDASITYDGTNLVIDPDLVGTGTVRIAGTEGADKLTITAGDAVISDGSLLITDDDDAVSFGVTNNTATTVGAGVNTSGLVDISSTSLTTGNLLNLETTTSLTSGRVLNASSTSTALTSGTLGRFDWSPGSATTASGDLLSINIGTNGTTTGDLFSVMDTSSDLFRVNESIITSALPHEFTAAGDVSIAYDIQFTNQTASYIKSKAPLYFDVGETFESNNATFNIYNAGGVVVDGSTDVNTGTTGVLDLNVNSITNNNVGLNIDYISNDGVASGEDLFSAKINLTQNDANGDLFGLLIDAAATTNATTGSYEYLTRLNNNETTADSVTDYLLINTASADTTADAIDVSDSDLFNALNVGPNTITGTTYAINSTAGNLSIQANFNTANLLLSGGDTLPSSVADGNDLEARAEDDIFLNPTDDVRLYANGAAVDCSGSGNGGALTTDASGIIQCSADDGGGAATTLQTAYDNDVDGGNATITLSANDDGIVFTNPDVTGNDLSAFVFQINQSDTDAAVAALDITQTSTNAAASAINITSAVATTSNIIAFDNTGNTAWTGNILDITTGTGNATGNLIDLAIEDSTNDDVQAIVLNAAGVPDQAGWAYEVNATGAFSAAAFDIDSTAAQTGAVFHVDNSGNAAWTGHILDVETGTGDYTGNVIDVLLEASTANDGNFITVVGDDEFDQAGWFANVDAQAAFTSSMIQFDSTTNDAWTGNLIDVDTGTGNVSGNIIDVNFEATTNNDAQFIVLANADESDQAGWLADIDTSAAWTSNAVDFTTGAQAWTGNVLDFNFGNAAATGDVININNPALAVATQAIVLDNAAASSVVGWALDLNASGAWTGNAIDFVQSAGVSTGDVISYDNSGNTATTGDFLSFASGTGDADGDVFDITVEAGATSTQIFDVNNAATSDEAGWLLEVDTSGIFTGNMIDIALGAQAATGEIINIDTGATAVNSQALVVTTGSAARTASAIRVNDQNTTGTVATFDLDGTGTRGGLFDIDWSGALATENLIDIDANSIATASIIDITANGLTTGSGLAIASSGTIASGGELLSLSGTGITSGRLLDISSAANTLNTGQLVNISSSATSITTGSLFASSLTGASAFTGNLNYFDWTPSATTTTGDIVEIHLGPSGNVGNLLNIVDDTSSIFSVSESAITSALPHSFTAAGDVAIAYDLQFTNQTSSSIKTNAPLTVEAGESSENNNLTLKTYGTGKIITDGGFSLNTQDTLEDSTTPSVGGASHFVEANGTNRVVTNFTNGTAGQIITIEVTTANLDLDCIGASLNCGATDPLTTAAGDMVTFVYDGSIWNMIAFMDDSLTNGGVGTDIAELFPTSEPLEPGDVVSIHSTQPVTMQKATISDDKRVIGVVSTEPGVTLGQQTGNDAAIALAGRVPIKISETSEAILPGDLVSASPTSGRAQKLVGSGWVVGRALDSWQPGQGQDKITIYVNPIYFSEGSGFADSQDASGSAQLADRVTTLENDFALLQTQLDLGQEASSSANFTDLTVNNLTVLNDVVLGDTVINGKLNVGTLQFDNINNSIDAIGTLKIQPMSLSGIEFLGGLITFDTNGNIVAKEVTADKYNVAGASAGTDTLPANEVEVFISSSAVEANSLILVTPKTLIDYPLVVTDKQDGLGFSVKMSVSSSTDTLFDWFIVDKVGGQ